MTNETTELGAFIDDGAAYRIRTNQVPDDWFNVHFSIHGHNHYYSLIGHSRRGRQLDVFRAHSIIVNVV